jgi:GMP synthase (glutamine-hydrolysing)
MPYFGACYGVGLLAGFCGGVVSKEKYSEDVSAAKISLTAEGLKDSLCRGLKKEFFAVVGHKEACQLLPKGAVLLAGSEKCPIELFRLKKNIYACQFHPELDLDGIALRLEVYKKAGYFPPEEARSILEEIKKFDLSEVPKILANFVKLYKK